MLKDSPLPQLFVIKVTSATVVRINKHQLLQIHWIAGVHAQKGSTARQLQLLLTHAHQGHIQHQTSQLLLQLVFHAQRVITALKLVRVRCKDNVLQVITVQLVQSHQLLKAPIAGQDTTAQQGVQPQQYALVVLINLCPSSLRALLAQLVIIVRKEQPSIRQRLA